MSDKNGDGEGGGDKESEVWGEGVKEKDWGRNMAGAIQKAVNGSKTEETIVLELAF